MRRLRIPLLLLFGLILGIALGLLIGWVAWPAEFTNASPELLDDRYKQEYVLMIAAAYAQDNDLNAAQTRLTSLGAESNEFMLSFLLDKILAQDNEAEIRQLTRLAAALGLYSPAMDPYLPTPEGVQP
jgi:hypothetical protein